MSRTYLHAEGRDLVVEIIPDGLPEFTGIVPAPWLSERDRQQRVQDARRGIWIQGMTIVSERRVRNDAFDDDGQQTSTELVYRPCRDEREAQHVAEKAAGLLWLHAPKGTWRPFSVGGEQTADR